MKRKGPGPLRRLLYRVRIPISTFFVLLSVALTLLFVFVEAFQFYGSTASYLKSYSETLVDASFTHAGNLLTENLSHLVTVAQLTTNDQELQKVLQDATVKSPSAKVQSSRILQQLRYKGRLIQPEIDAILVLTDFGYYNSNSLIPSGVRKEVFLSQFLLSGGGWHFPGDPTDLSTAQTSAFQTLSQRIFYVLPFSVHSENDSCVCVVASASFLEHIFPQDLPAAVLSPSGGVLLNRTSERASALREGGATAMRMADSVGGTSLFFKTATGSAGETLSRLRHFLLLMIPALCTLACILSLALSQPLARPLRAFAQKLAGTAPPGQDQAVWRHAIPIREHILLMLLVTVSSSCLLFAFSSSRFFLSISTETFAASSEDAFAQAAAQTETFFQNQHYATLYTAYSGELQSELAAEAEPDAAANADRLADILSSYRSIFLRPTSLTLYDTGGTPVASTDPVHADQEPLSRFPSHGETFWDIGRESGTWQFSLLSQINDTEALTSIGYFRSRIDEIYLAESYSSLPDGATAYLHREDGTVLSSSDKLSIGQPLPDAPQDALSFSCAIDDTPLTLTVFFDTAPLLAEQAAANLRSFYLLFAILVLTIVVSLLVSHYFSDRLYRIFQALAAVSPENPALTALEASVTSEIDRMNRAFEEMETRVRLLHERSLENERREKELEVSRQQAQFAMLQAQINPHFLYNSFEAITFMIRRDEKSGAIEMLSALSTMMRYAVRTDEALVPVAEELLYAKTYTEIMKLRYAGLLTVDFSFSDEAMRLKMVKFTLQPLLENAINHGFRPRSGQGSIQITGMVAAGKLIVAVRDDGVGIDLESLAALQTSLSEVGSSRHIGLSNIHNRIRAMYGSGYGLQIASTPGSGTVVTLLLPVLP